MSTLRASREATVRAHIDSEIRHDFDATLATFHRPHYDVAPTGELHIGADAVAAFLRGTHDAFPDFGFQLHAMHHGDDAVLTEVTFEGTHLGNWRGLPATGRRVAYRMCNAFCFEDDKLVSEKLYFDLLTPMRQLGIARDPTTLAGRLTIFASHPLTLASAGLRLLRGR